MTVPYQSLHEEIAFLRRERDRLAVTVKWLTDEKNRTNKEANTNINKLRLAFPGLAPAHAKMLFLLSDGQQHSYQEIADALGTEGGQSSGKNPKIWGTLHAYKCRVQQIVPGLRVTKLWGFGLWLEGQSLSRIRIVLATVNPKGATNA